MRKWVTDSLIDSDLLLSQHAEHERVVFRGPELHALRHSQVLSELLAQLGGAVYTLVGRGQLRRLGKIREVQTLLALQGAEGADVVAAQHALLGQRDRHGSRSFGGVQGLYFDVHGFLFECLVAIVRCHGQRISKRNHLASSGDSNCHLHSAVRSIPYAPVLGHIPRKPCGVSSCGYL